MCMNNHDFPPILSGLFNFARFLGSNDNGETLQLDTLISINSIVTYGSTTIKVFRLSKTYPGSRLNCEGTWSLTVFYFHICLSHQSRLQLHIIEEIIILIMEF